MAECVGQYTHFEAYLLWLKFYIAQFLCFNGKFNVGEELGM